MHSPVVARFIAGIALTVSSALVNAQAPGPQEGVDYTVVKPVQVTAPAVGKTSAIEFFGYWCPHCSVFEPSFSEWKQRTTRVDVTYVPVAFQAGQVQLQRLYYALDAVGEEQRLRPLIFKAIHEEPKTLTGTPDDAAMTEWVVKHGVDRKKFDDALHAFSMPAKLVHANQLAKDYGLSGVPALAIGGKYLLNVQARSIGNADIFVDRVLTEKK